MAAIDKHTPGPWRVLATKGAPGWQELRIKDSNKKEHGLYAKQIAYMKCIPMPHAPGYVSEEETRANAHLIAAAPEMFDMLDKIASLELDDAGEFAQVDADTIDDICRLIHRICNSTEV